MVNTATICFQYVLFEIEVFIKHYQLMAVPDIAYHVGKRVMRMSWLMVSKAVNRSVQLLCHFNVKVYVIVYF